MTHYTTSRNNNSHTSVITDKTKVTQNDLYEDKTTMQSLTELLGLHYYETRTVFDIDGQELVYLNDNLLGFIKVYLDGEEIYNGWEFISCCFSDVCIQHKDTEYRFISSIRNWLTCSQKVTVIVDDTKAQSKIDPVLGGLKGWDLAHAILGTVATGLILGFAFGFIS